MVRFRLLCGDFLLPDPAPHLENHMTVCMGYPKYGVQKGWKRVTSPETGAENFSEITDAEAKQLGFPF